LFEGDSYPCRQWDGSFFFGLCDLRRHYEGYHRLGAEYKVGLSQLNNLTDTQAGIEHEKSHRVISESLCILLFCTLFDEDFGKYLVTLCHC